MGKTYPALDVTGASLDLILAIVDDYAPTAADEHDSTVSIFFSDDDSRQHALAAVRDAFPAASIAARDVDDGDWARRSQENLTPVRVGRIIVTPPWHSSGKQDAGSREQELVITPSMGFGTGHHATTRLCLAALQTRELNGRTVLDVGTGSGVLALAARVLGARDAVGLDMDEDAIQAAEENLAANPSIDRVLFVTGDLRTVPLESADVVVANLTGALLVQSAALLLAATRPGGALIVSGLLRHERQAVVDALKPARVVWERDEDDWVGLALNISGPAPV